GVRGEVRSAGQEACLQLRQSVAALAKGAPDVWEVGQVEEHGARVAREDLLEAEEACSFSEVARAQELELPSVPPIVVRTARDSVDRVDDYVGLEQRRLPVQEVRRRGAGGKRQHGGELRRRDR